VVVLINSFINSNICTILLFVGVIMSEGVDICMVFINSFI